MQNYLLLCRRWLYFFGNVLHKVLSNHTETAVFYSWRIHASLYLVLCCKEVDRIVNGTR
uniref:Predicted protein n=1 Tax=Hordeum vulgare subsp. vulgare TaxID=112509 RepID=F2EG67_HORVV|nr:predicted protein [Hordeum vulgare subsp. vulgare]